MTPSDFWTIVFVGIALWGISGWLANLLSGGDE